MGCTVRLDARPRAPGFGRLRDLSLSGGYVEGISALPPWSSVYVDLDWVYGARTARVKAYVVRNERGGLAVEWCELAPRAIRCLIEAVARPVSGVEHREAPVPRGDFSGIPLRAYATSMPKSAAASGLRPAGGGGSSC